MSKFLSNVFIEEFESDVHAEFQSEGFLLRNSIRVKENVVGNTVQFPVQKRGIANQKASQDDVSPMNIGYEPIQMTLEPWLAPEYTDIFDQQAINFDDRMELVKASSYAIGRRADQLIIDALNLGYQAAGGTTVNNAAGFGFTEFRQAFKALRRNAAAQEIYCTISATAEDDLLNVQNLTNTFFVQNKALASNGFHGMTIMGVTFIVMPDMDEGGLPLTGNNRTCFMWAKQSTGFGIGIGFKTEINYVPQKTSWLVNSLIKANAVAIDPLGIVGIIIDESIVI